MAANTFSFPANLLRYSQSFDAKRGTAPSFLPSSSMFGNELLIRPQLNSSRFVTKYHRSSATATVSFSLPTTVQVLIAFFLRVGLVETVQFDL